MLFNMWHYVSLQIILTSKAMKKKFLWWEKYICEFHFVSLLLEVEIMKGEFVYAILFM
jgi:hypothetical protein